MQLQVGKTYHATTSRQNLPCTSTKWRVGLRLRSRRVPRGQFHIQSATQANRSDRRKHRRKRQHQRTSEITQAFGAARVVRHREKWEKLFLEQLVLPNNRSPLKREYRHEQAPSGAFVIIELGAFFHLIMNGINQLNKTMTDSDRKRRNMLTICRLNRTMQNQMTHRHIQRHTKLTNLNNINHSLTLLKPLKHPQINTGSRTQFLLRFALAHTLLSEKLHDRVYLM